MSAAAVICVMFLSGNLYSSFLSCNFVIFIIIYTFLTISAKSN